MLSPIGLILSVHTINFTQKSLREYTINQHGVLRYHWVGSFLMESTCNYKLHSGMYTAPCIIVHSARKEWWLCWSTVHMRNNLIIHAEVDFFAVPANLLVQLPPLLQSPFQSPLKRRQHNLFGQSRFKTKLRVTYGHLQVAMRNSQNKLCDKYRRKYIYGASTRTWTRCIYWGYDEFLDV